MEAFKVYKSLPLPNWGPDLKELKLEEIIYYVSPKVGEKTSWEEVPKEISETFEKLRHTKSREVSRRSRSSI